MKIEVELVDAFMLTLGDGKTTKARVARLRYQTFPRKPWKVANLVVDDPTPSRVMQGVAAYLAQQEPKSGT